MEANFTPGPWEVNTPGSIRIGGILLTLGYSGGIGKGTLEYRKANANLIAAAPDLLAAAKSALAFLEQITYIGGGNTPGANLMRAIAKATGT